MKTLDTVWVFTPLGWKEYRAQRYTLTSKKLYYLQLRGALMIWLKDKTITASTYYIEQSE